MSTVQSAAPTEGLLLHGVDWRTYSRLLRAFEGHPSVRLTYDHGTLQIMSPTHGHESDAYLVGRFIDVLTEELKMKVHAGRSTTFRRRKKKRGLEPDNSYWLANEKAVRGKRRIDLAVDPPPDLAVEVDVTHSSVDRMAIYAAFGVAEIWRISDQGLSFHLLDADGKYAASGGSLAFPGLTAVTITSFLALLQRMDDNEVVAEFRTWVRQQLAVGVLTKPGP